MGKLNFSHVLVIIAVGIVFAVGVLYTGALDSGTDAYTTTPCSHAAARQLHYFHCAWIFESYTQAVTESQWATHVQEYQDSVCEHSNHDIDGIQHWLNCTSANQVRDAANVTSPQTFSSFTFRNNCTKESLVDKIEPLAGLTRHPNLCLRGIEFLVDKSYLFVSWRVADKLRPLSDGYVPRAYYFDLGASLYTTGLGGASQSWIVEEYERRGAHFDGIYAWEAEPQDSRVVWSQIPERLRLVYHWFNVPANTTPGSPDNSLDMMLAVARPQDFVVLKIDIDNTEVEERFIAQLLGSPELLAVVDDMYFEHHVNVGPMNLYWKTYEVPQRLADTYHIFGQLRTAGVLAHSWV